MASLAEVVDDFGAQAPGGLTAEGVELGAVLDTRYDPRARSGRSFDIARGGRARSVDLHQRVSMETTTLSEDIPPNPRDHSVLEHIYTEMHASRFVNLAPLSLLANTLRLHFEGMTHLLVVDVCVDLAPRRAIPSAFGVLVPAEAAAASRGQQFRRLALGL